MKKFVAGLLLSAVATAGFAMEVIRGGVPPANSEEATIMFGYSKSVFERESGSTTCSQETELTIMENSLTTVIRERKNRMLPLASVLSSEMKTLIGRAVASKTCHPSVPNGPKRRLTVNDLTTLLAGNPTQVLFARGFILAAHDAAVLRKCQSESAIEDVGLFFREVSAAISKAKQLNNGDESATLVLDVLFSTMKISYKCI